jgi:hypothetical protein
MLTQIVRYGRMLKANITTARCHVKGHWSSEGSVFAGTITSSCHGIETHLEVTSDDDPALVAAVLRNAEGGCYAQSLVQEPVQVTGKATVNGQEFDYRSYPARAPRRR